MLLVAGPPSGRHLSYGPALAVVVVLGLGLLSRWVLSPSREQQQRRELARERRDFGLLVPVATLDDRADALRLQDRVLAAGIRCTVALEPPGPTLVSSSGRARPQPGGRHQVLVFAGDEARARAVLDT